MGLFDAFKRKPAEPMELPPPPIPDEFELPPMPEPEASQEPEMPELPAEVHEEPDIPEAEHHAEVHQPMREGPLFVSMQDYQAILSDVNGIRAKISDAEDSFKKLGEL
ncbi:hypothetical protein HY492_01560, partial [Candidatus Woesearchaeota archaeon]|nr:hypothetical protein [Candidatus Woesearchaeota archaeon]